MQVEIKGVPVHTCQLCKETFSNYYDLDEHVKTHASKQLAADGTSSSVLLAKPLEYHCTHCAKQSLKQVFASLLALEQHVTHMHTGKGNKKSQYIKTVGAVVPRLSQTADRI